LASFTTMPTPQERDITCRIEREAIGTRDKPEVSTSIHCASSMHCATRFSTNPGQPA
jgi:hypothetical protein